MTNNTTSVKLTLKVASFVLRLLLNIVFYILVVILIVNVSKMVYDFTYQLYGPVTAEAAPGTDIIVQIQKGDSTMDVASKLELDLAITNKYAFYLKTKLEHSVIMPGTYKINSSMTYGELLAIITDYTQSIVKEEEDTATGSNTGAGTDKAADTNTGTDSNTNTDTNTGTNTNTDSDTNAGTQTNTN